MNWVATAKTIILDHTYVLQSTLCCILAAEESAQICLNPRFVTRHINLCSSWMLEKHWNASFQGYFFHGYIKTRTAAATVFSPPVANYRHYILPCVWWGMVMMCALDSCWSFCVSFLDCFLQFECPFFLCFMPHPVQGEQDGLSSDPTWSKKIE